MGNWLESAERQLKAHAGTLQGVEIIGRLVRAGLVDAKSDAYAILQVIERVIDTIIAGHEGKVSPENIIAEFSKISEMRDFGKHPNDAAADDAVDKKFGDQ